MKLSTLCYVKNDHKTLMLHRVKKENDIHEGKWVGLGGKVENGESPEECAIREVKEESGLLINAPVLKGVLTFPKFKNQEDWYVFLYVAYSFSGELSECDEGILKWIDDSALFELNLWEGDQIFLKYLEKEGIFSGKFVYEEKKLIKSQMKPIKIN